MNTNNTMKAHQKEATKNAINLLSEMIERANRDKTYSVSVGDFLYYNLGEVRDKLKQSLSKDKPF